LLYLDAEKINMEYNFDPFPILLTDRLTLRKVQAHDEVEVYKLRSDERVMKFIDKPRANSIEDARLLINTINDHLENNKGITGQLLYKVIPF